MRPFANVNARCYRFADSFANDTYSFWSESVPLYVAVMHEGLKFAAPRPATRSALAKNSASLTFLNYAQDREAE